MPEDKFGNPFFYPTKPGGLFYEQSDDPTNDSNFDPPDSLHADTGGIFTMHVSGPTDFGIFKHTGFKDAIGGCDMNFAQTEDRGYAWKSDDFRDIEMKMLVSLEMSNSDNGLSLSGPTGHHASNSSPCCQGFSYMFTMEYNLNPTTFRFRKEMWHVSYHDDPVYGEWTHPLVPGKLNNTGWFGLGYCRYNKKDGRSAGKDSVILEIWFNPDPISNIKNWTMLKRLEDKGNNWGNDGDQCNGAKDQVGTWGSAQCRTKSNDPDGDLHVKCLSLREIDAFASFDDNPSEPPPDEQPPSTTTVQGLFKFQWDINQLRSSPCAGVGTGGGGGGEVGNAKFYEVTDTSDGKELSDSSTWQHRTRIAMSPANSSSVFYNKLPIQVDILLKKSGSPTGQIRIKIWNSGGTTLYTSPTILDASTLTTSFVSYHFDLSTNTTAMATGYRIGVEYSGTSSSNYVLAAYSGSSTSNTNYYQYEGSSWDSKSRSLSMTVWQ